MLRRFFPRDPFDGAPSLVLQPRVAPAGHLRVWVAAFDGAPGTLRWRLDGQAVQPRSLHPGGPGLVPAHRHGTRTHYGVFELGPAHGVVPGRRHRVGLHEGGRPPATLEVETIPDSVPRAMDGELRILLVSCFHQAEDRDGAAGRVVSEIPEAERPHFTLLMGDQVYLDLPTLSNFPKTEAELARRFERDYRLNWAMPTGYSQVLAAAPSVASPDDHEYWNNFPHPAPIIENSWSPEGRRSWKAAADRLYSAFQLAHPAELGDPVTIDVDPLSVLVLDGRSKRRPDTGATLAPGVIGRVSAWVDRLLADDGYGVVVTGQSLLDPPTGRFEGKVKDRVLADYSDYRPLMSELERLADGGRPVLLLTGDVHWGRVTAIHRQDGRVRFYEVITSPSSLVTTVGADQVAGLGAGLGQLFGREPDPWPRHGDPDEKVGDHLGQTFGHGYAAEILERQKGNQVATLAFRRRGGGLELDITYHPIHGSLRPTRVGPLVFPPR